MNFTLLFTQAFTQVKPLKKIALSVVASLLIITPAVAHDIYIWPSYFNTNVEKPKYISVDITASHTTFRPDFAMPSSGLKVLGVDGKKIRRVGSFFQGNTRSTFDLHVKEPGTYGLFYQREPSYFTRYIVGKRNTEKHMRASKIDSVAKLPKGAREVETRGYATIAMSFLTNKAPTTEALAPTNKGFELIALTHPSDYVTGEPIEVKALFNGKPVAEQTLTIEQEAPKYRKNPAALEVTTNEDGLATFTLDNGGRYLLKTNHEQASESELADFDVMRIYYSFEVIFE
jgi:uncharacterized GH25 family protein